MSLFCGKLVIDRTEKKNKKKEQTSLNETIFFLMRQKYGPDVSSDKRSSKLPVRLLLHNQVIPSA